MGHSATPAPLGNGTPTASEPHRKQPLFPLGRILATPGILEHFDRHKINAQPYLERHQGGDWGDVPADDKRENDLSVENGFRLLSAYSAGGARFWIITEADRSATTLLFPCEY